ncbi:MAG: TIGR00341 family protein, partial [Bythopirellula sp.]
SVVGSEGCEPLSQEFVHAAQDFFSQQELTDPSEIIGVSGPSDATAAIEIARQKNAELIVAAAHDPTGASGTTYATNPLFKQSPCNTIVLFGGSTRSIEPKQIFVAATDNLNDEVAIFLASRMVENCDACATFARAELETEQLGLEVGRREIKSLIRNAGVDNADRFDCQVFPTGGYEEVATAMDEHDLVLIGSSYPRVPTFVELTQKPTVAVIQRAPPLRPWQTAQRAASWKPRLSPADYAELIHGLRHGSRLSVDFITMLSLAAIVAALGLLQDSPAVVIGSMLLAPLMTPMIGCGLALAQANQKFGNTALKTVGVGLVCTLAISYLVGLITPGAELTPQIYARGEPTVLDLVVALASAAAAAYALARPNLVGSVAGVAIATALLPPLCSAGLSLAYRDLMIAQGAALLFVTNFLAIVLSAAVTFRFIGITAEQAGRRQKLWVFRTASILGIAAILVCIPLQRELLEGLVETKAQPRAFPLAKTVVDALEDRIAAEPGVTLITAGRPSSHLVASDVVLITGALGELDPSFADDLIEIVREKMQDDSLIVEVHCIKELWQETSK